MTTSILTVAGVAYNQAARKANSLLLDSWSWDLDGDMSLEFHEYVAKPTPRFIGPAPVSLTVDGSTVFAGDLVTSFPGLSAQGRTWGYRCLGLKYRANWIPVTAVDGSGTIRFNVPVQDLQNYNVSLAGQSVGQIITYCLTQHATQLTNAGITTDATTSSALAALTLVPQDQVTVQGERLWQAMEAVLAQWARNIRLVILGSGLVRVVDVTGGTTHTLTVGTDPIDPPMLSRNWTHSATRSNVRGRANVAVGYVSVVKNTLTPAWTAAEQTAWHYSDFLQPKNALSTGTVVSVDGPTQVTISSSVSTETWPLNYWDGLQAWIYLFNVSGSGLTYQESRPVTANGALTAGGHATITLGYDLENATAGAFNAYQLIGTNVPLSSGGLADVWRLYNVTDPGNLISKHLMLNFPYPVPFFAANGQAVKLTNTPMMMVFNANGGTSVPFEVLPQSGQILFVRPVVEITTPLSNLLGGSPGTAPVDIYGMLAYSRGALVAPYPADVSGAPRYSGQAYSYAGLARTQVIDVDSWQYAGNNPLMAQLAQMMWQSTSYTLIEGPINYKGYYSAVQDPTGGHKISLAGCNYTPPPDETGLPVRAVTYRYLTGGGGLLHETSLRISTRQDPRTGESQYMHLSVLGGQSLTTQWEGRAVTGGITTGGIAVGPGGPITVGTAAGVDTSQAGEFTLQKQRTAMAKDRAKQDEERQERLRDVAQKQGFMGGAAGITPESLGLDKSAMELSGFDPSQYRDDRRQWQRRGPQGLKGLRDPAEREQAVRGREQSEAQRRQEVEDKVQEDNRARLGARLGAGMRNRAPGPEEVAGPPRPARQEMEANIRQTRRRERGQMRTRKPEALEGTAEGARSGTGIGDVDINEGR